MPRLLIAVMLMLMPALALVTTAVAQPPETVNFQGTLKTSGGMAVPDGNYNLTFRIYDQAVGGAPLWSEVQNVAVAGSLFNVILGLANPLSLPFDQQYWLSIQVDVDPELTPRIPLTSVPYALNVADGKVVKSLNGVTDHVNLLGGANINVSTVGQDITISGTGAVADNDWNVTGVDMTSIPTGNVGIGLVPGTKLDVAGDVRAGTASTPGRLLARIGNGTLASIFGGDYAGYGSLIQTIAEDGNETFSIEPDVDGEGGFILLRRSNAAYGFIVDGNYGGTFSSNVIASGTGSSVEFRTDLTGDDAVQLPTDAVAALELLDEPGLASNEAFATSSLSLPTSTTTIVSRTINCPTGGFVLVVANCEIELTASGSSIYATVGVSNSLATLPDNQDLSFYLPSTAANGLYLTPHAASGIFPVSAGSHTFYLNGNANISGVARIWDAQLNVIFFPTAYGLVVDAGSKNALVAFDQFKNPSASAPAPTAADLAAERAESEAFDQARIQEELSAMRAKLAALQQRLENLNAPQDGR
jgi:hypothetical protein